MPTKLVVDLSAEVQITTTSTSVELVTASGAQITFLFGGEREFKSDLVFDGSPVVLKDLGNDPDQLAKALRARQPQSLKRRARLLLQNFISKKCRQKGLRLQGEVKLEL